MRASELCHVLRLLGRAPRNPLYERVGHDLSTGAVIECRIGGALQDCWGGATKRATLTTTLVPGKGAHRRVSLVAALGDGGKTPPWSTTADTEGFAELVWLARHAVYGLA